MGRRDADLYEEEYRESEATRAARPASVPPSYEDEIYDPEATHSALEAYNVLTPFVAPAEIEGDRSPAMRARRLSYVDRAEIHIARSQEFATSAPEVEEVTSFTERPLRPASRPAAPPRSGAADDRPLDYDALKRFLFEDGPDPGAPDYEPLPSQKTPVSPIGRSEVPPAPRSVRAAMTSAHPEFEGPRGRQPMMSSHPDFEGPRGSRRQPMMSSHPDFEGPRGGRQQMFSSHPDFEGPRGGRQPMMSSHPDFEGPRGGYRAPVISHPDLDLSRSSSRGRQPPPCAPPEPTAAQMAETADRLPRVPGARGPMLALQDHTFGMQGAPPHPVREESVSVDGNWIVPTPPPMSMPAMAMAITNRRGGGLPAESFKVTLSLLAAVLTAIAALVVMVGAVLFIRTDTTPAPAAFDQPLAAEPLPVAATAQPVAMVNVAPIANANARGDQTPAPAASGVAPPPPPDPAAAKDAAKGAKKTKKRAAAKPAVEEDDSEEQAPQPKTAKKPAKTADKDVEKVLADLQEQQLRR